MIHGCPKPDRCPVYGRWPDELAIAHRSDVFPRERFYEAIKENLQRIVDYENSEAATAGTAKAELIRMQQAIVDDPRTDASIFGRMADAVLDSEQVVIPQVLASMFENVVGTRRSRKGFKNGSAGAFYLRLCQDAFKAVNRPWKIRDAAVVGQGRDPWDQERGGLSE